MPDCENCNYSLAIIAGVVLMTLFLIALSYYNGIVQDRNSYCRGYGFISLGEKESSLKEITELKKQISDFNEIK